MNVLLYTYGVWFCYAVNLLIRFDFAWWATNDSVIWQKRQPQSWLLLLFNLFDLNEDSASSVQQIVLDN